MSDGLSLADELRRLRVKRRIGSQEELARLSGVARNTINKLETGVTQPTSATLYLIARGLAKDDNEVVDIELAERFYERLTRLAAGLSPEKARDTGAGITREEMAATLTRLLGRKD